MQAARVSGTVRNWRQPRSAFFIDSRGQEQPLFLVKAQGLYGNPVHLGKLADPVQVIRRFIGKAIVTAVQFYFDNPPSFIRRKNCTSSP